MCLISSQAAKCSCFFLNKITCLRPGHSGQAGKIRKSSADYSFGAYAWYGAKAKALNAMLYALCAMLLLISTTSVKAAVLTSIQTGNWTDASTWDLGYVPLATDDIVIAAGHTVSIPNSAGNQTITNFTINTGGIFNNSNKRVIVTGNYTNNGTHAGSIAARTTLNTPGASVDGIGTIHFGDFVFENGVKTILSTANLTKAFGDFVIGSGVTVTNNGTITSAERLDGVDATTSIWVNAVGSTLNFGGDTLLPVGVLTASAPGNTINYYSSGDQPIKIPTANTYYNLSLSGTGIKILMGNLIIAGNLAINSVTLDVDVTNNYSLNIGGDWTNSGVFDEQLGTVTFDGTADQTITNTLGETFYILRIDKTGGNLILNDNITVTTTLIMNQGNIVTGTNVITVGTSIANIGALAYTSGTVVGQYKKWVNAIGVGYNLPLGTSADYRPFNYTLTNLMGGGGTITGEFISSAPGNSGLSLSDAGVTIYNTFVEGYWSLTGGDGLNTNSFDIEATGNGFTSFTIVASTRLLTRADAGSLWSAEGTHVAAVGNTAKRTGTSTLPAHYAFGDTTNCTGPATSTITGPDSVCTDVTGVLYYVTDNPPNFYSWTVTGGTKVLDNGDSITVDWGSAGMVGDVTVIETNTCSEGAPVSRAVNIHSLPTSVITGKANVAAFTTGVPYSVTARPGYSPYTWSVTGGGTIVSGQGTNSITVDWGAAGAGNVSVVASSGCGDAPSVGLDVNIYIVINSIVNGAWNLTATWDCNCVPDFFDNIRIQNTHTVTLTTNEVINHFEVVAGGVFDAAAKRLEVTGDFNLNGEYNGTNNLTLSGAGTNIDGAGNIFNTGTLIISGGAKTILSTAVLTKSSGSFQIGSGIAVTNQGNITLGGDITGAASTTTWVNDTRSTLNIGGIMLSTGTFFASAANNLVSYYGAVAQSIKLPNASTYHGLSITGSGIKTLTGNTIINGDVNITSTFDVDAASNYSIDMLGNWTNSGTFNAQIGKVTFRGSAAQSITNTTGESFYDLVINNSSGINLGGPVTVNDSLILTNGIVNTTSANILIIADNATSTSGSSTSFVDGPMRKVGNDAFVFPVGDSIIWARIGISAPATLTAAFEAQYFNATYANTVSVGTLNNVSKLEHWILNRTAGVDAVTVTLYWEDGTRSDINDLPDLVVARFDGTNWIDETQAGGVTGTVVAGTVTSQVVSSFSPFTFGSNSAAVNALPVDLVFFTAELEGDKVVIEWATASEINNDYFTVQRSADGDISLSSVQGFEDLVNIDGGGTSNMTLYYTVIDNNPIFGTSYYRLLQTDHDGQREYFDAIRVSYLPENQIFSIYPNPTKGDDLHLTIKTSKDQHLRIVITDVVGKKYFLQVVVLNEGENSIEIDAAGKLSPGVYNLTGTIDDNFLFFKKFVVE